MLHPLTFHVQPRPPSAGPLEACAILAGAHAPPKRNLDLSRPAMPTELETAPDFVAVGHVTRDLLADGERLGGTVTFAALTARRLGLRAAVVTSAGPDLDWAATLAGVEVACVPAEETTTFANEYAGGARRQRLLGRAAPLGVADIPAAWRRPEFALIGPVAGECAPDLLDAFPEARVALTPQGWLRAWDAQGWVRFAPWPEAERVLPHAAVTVL